MLALHAGETLPAMTVCKVKRFCKLPRIGGAGADIAHFPGPNRVVERGKSFFYGRFVVPAVYLQEIDVISS